MHVHTLPAKQGREKLGTWRDHEEGRKDTCSTGAPNGPTKLPLDLCITIQLSIQTLDLWALGRGPFDSDYRGPA